jgi:hypothetical protein
MAQHAGCQPAAVTNLHGGKPQTLQVVLLKSKMRVQERQED